MCGRFTLTSSPGQIAAHFEVDALPELAPRFNVAPTQPVLVVRADADAGARVAELRRWGLVPPWARDPAIASRLINARAETAASKPAFRAAFRRRRCLVAADGFYEWQARGRRKQPWWIHRPDGAPFGIAGLWEHWEDEDGRRLDTCTLLTTEANAVVAGIHRRMPVILAPDDYDAWLDPDRREPDALEPLLRPCPEAWLVAHPVSTDVNDPGRDEPGVIRPVDPASASGPQELLL